jgi:hypothetical protein
MTGSVGLAEIVGSFSCILYSAVHGLDAKARVCRKCELCSACSCSSALYCGGKRIVRSHASHITECGYLEQ